MKTEEEILSQYKEYSVIVGGEATYRATEVLAAMVEYADQFRKSELKFSIEKIPISNYVVLERISIKERLPNTGQNVLFESNLGIVAGYCDGVYPDGTLKGYYDNEHPLDSGITHWMPLPEPVKS
jgi:hypothetical protein